MSAVAETIPSLSTEVASFLENPKKLLINGQWGQAVSGRTFDVIDPATGQAIAQAAEGD